MSDAVLEYFLESALEDFAIGRVEQTQWHPDYRSRRVVLYVLEKKSKRCLADDSPLNKFLLAIEVCLFVYTLHCMMTTTYH